MQVHFINEQECLLVRGGFNHILSGSVIDRSNSGFFYVIPHSVSDLKEKQSDLKTNKRRFYLNFVKKFLIFLKKIYFF